MIEMHTTVMRSVRAPKRAADAATVGRLGLLVTACVLGLAVQACTKENTDAGSAMDPAGVSGQASSDSRAADGGHAGNVGAGASATVPSAAGAAGASEPRPKPAVTMPNAGAAGYASADDAGAGGDGSAVSMVDPELAGQIGALASDLAEAVCGALRTCLGPQKLSAFVGREPCETRFAASLGQDDFGSLATSIARGRVKFQHDQLAQCYADTRALGCSIQSDRLPDSCQRAIAGQVGTGDSCSIGSDCTGDAFCTLGECPRVCKARVTTGDSCQRDEECANGLICLSQHCAKPAALGADCAGTTGAVCALGTSCVGSTKTQAGKCTANAEVQSGAEGAACTPGGTLCLEGLSCAYDGVSGFTCQSAASLGAACHKALPSQCPNDTYCSAQEVTDDGVCETLPGDGKACVLAGDCAAGNVCVADASGNPVCRQQHDLSESCDQDVVCRSGVCTSGKCAVRAVCN
jgi:hypothetical protein